MLHLLHASNHDLVAAGAKYHKHCFSKYTSKTNVKHWVLKDQQEDSYGNSFAVLAKTIQLELMAGRAYDMDNLLQMYKVLLEENGVSQEKAILCSKQHLKIRLLKHFGKGIVFHKPQVRSQSEFIYSSSVSLQDVLNAAYRQSKNPQAQKSTHH